MPNLRLTFDKGLNADALASEVGDGFVTDCSNTRFRNGFAEAISDGVLTADLVATQLGTLSALHLDSATYVVGAGASPREVHAWTYGTVNVNEITKYEDGVTVSSMTAVGTTVTVTTSSNHGATTGDIISMWGASPSTYNVEGAAITVTGATTFTYTVASAPASSPATLTGRYSRGTTHTNFSSTLTNAGEFNGLLLLNSAIDGLYFWAGDTSIPLRRVVRGYPAQKAQAFGNYIVLLAPTMSGVEYPYRILWSASAEPGSIPTTFVSSSTNDAGYVDRPDIGSLVVAAPLGNDLIIYGTRGRLLMRYIGGNEVFSFTRLVGDEGADSAIAVTPVGHVFVNTNKQVLIHNGGECKNLSENRVQSLLSQSVSGILVVAHPRQSEVWIGYQTAVGSVYATKFLVWNWVENTWGKRTVSSPGAVSAIAAGSGEKRLYFAIGDSLYEYDIEGGQTTAYVERKGITAGDADYVKNLSRSRWNFDTVSELAAIDTYTIQHGSHMVADGSPTYASSVSYLPESTDYCNARATGGRYLAVKATWSTSAGVSETPFHHIRVRSADLEFNVGGKR